MRACQLEALYTVALAAGLRISEALGLRWADVDMDSGWVEVRGQLKRIDGAWVRVADTKTEAGERGVFLPAVALDVLRAHRVRQVEEQLAAGAAWEGNAWPDLVFRTARGTPLDRRYCWHHFQQLLAAAGLEPLRIVVLGSFVFRLAAAAPVVRRQAEQAPRRPARC